MTDDDCDIFSLQAYKYPVLLGCLNQETPSTSKSWKKEINGVGVVGLLSFVKRHNNYVGMQFDQYIRGAYDKLPDFFRMGI